jgi:hypothetical protein
MKTRIAASFALALATIAAGTAAGPAAATPPDSPRANDGYRCPHGDKDGFKARKLIGKRIPQARRTARRHDCSFRITKRNGKHLVVTADYSPQRINVGVRHRTVTSIQGIG